jgi:hypothetical protein
MLVNILAPWSIWANGQCLDPVDSMFEHHIFYASGKKTTMRFELNPQEVNLESYERHARTIGQEQFRKPIPPR